VTQGYGNLNALICIDFNREDRCQMATETSPTMPICYDSDLDLHREFAPYSCRRAPNKRDEAIARDSPPCRRDVALGNSCFRWYEGEVN